MPNDPTPLPTPLMRAWIENSLGLDERLSNLEAKISALQPLLTLLVKSQGPSKVDQIAQQLTALTEELSAIHSTQRALSERLSTLDSSAVQPLTELASALTRSAETLRLERQKAEKISARLVSDATAIVDASGSAIRKRLEVRSWTVAGVWVFGLLQSAGLALLLVWTLSPTIPPLPSPSPLPAAHEPLSSQMPSPEPQKPQSAPAPTPSADSLPPLAPASPPAPEASPQVYVARISDSWSKIKERFPSARIAPPDGFWERPKNRTGDPMVWAGDRFTITPQPPAGR